MARFTSSLFALATMTALACSAAGCADDGAAPTVKDLSVNAASLSVGKAGTIEGTLTVEDVDGDIDELYAEIIIPDGRSQTLAPQKLQGASGLKSAPVKILLAVAPPAPGEYTLNVWVRDVADNDSPKLSSKFTVN